MRNIQAQDDLVELARICQEQSRVTPASDAAAELRRMAKEYQRRAAQQPGVSHVARVKNSRHAEIKDRVETPRRRARAIGSDHAPRVVRVP